MGGNIPEDMLEIYTYVMMSDLKFQASRKWMIIMLTELGVRGGPSLSLSLARAVTIPVIDGHLHLCGLDAVGSLGALALPLGGSRFVFPVPGMWACCLVCLLPRAVGFLVGCLLFLPVCGCWVCFSGLIGCLGWLCPYVGDWLMFIRCILYQADAPTPLF